MSRLARRLAAFSHARPEAAAAARATIALSLADWAGVAIAGQDEPVAAILRRHHPPRRRGAASVVGGGWLDPPAAALVNGTTSHALDYDDTHFAHIGHTSVVIVPAALAVAESEGRDGEALLQAMLIGAEAAIRVGLWLGRGHYQAGFHQTATAGAFGATLAAARLMRLGPGQSETALGLVASMAGGLKAQFGTMAKPLHAGLAARAGVEAAQLARAGLSANPAALDGPQGFGATHAGMAGAGAFDGLGRDWLVQGISPKFHACCHGTHAMLEALGQVEVAAGDIAQVEIRTHPRWLGVCNIERPATGLEVKFSYAHLAAMRLAGHDTAALEVFSDDLAADPALGRLAARVRVIGDDRVAETACRLRLVLTDGSTRQAGFDLQAPMTLEERRHRLAHKLAQLVGQGRAARLWQVAAAPPDIAGLGAFLRAGS